MFNTHKPLSVHRWLAAALVILSLLALSLLGLAVALRLANAFVETTPLHASTRYIETNSGYLLVEERGIFPRNERVLLASLESLPVAVVASRTRQELRMLRTSDLVEVASKSFGDLGLFSLKDAAGKEIYLFDLEFESKRSLLVSFVLTDRSADTCDVYGVARVQISERLAFGKLEELWRSDVCRSVVTSDYLWPDFTGRLEVVGNEVLITAGFSSMNMLAEVFPEPAMKGVLGSLSEEIRENELFGRVTGINLSTGQSVPVATGLRSPAGIAAVKAQDVTSIYVVDHGPRGGDELNMLGDNSNFGWPFVTLGQKYDSSETSMGILYGTHRGYDAPIYYWTPSIAPSQLVAVKSESFSSIGWNSGNLLLTTLKDKAIHKITLDGSSVISIERVEIGHRIRDADFGKNCLLLSTDNGLVVKLSVPKSAPEPEPGTFPSMIPSSWLDAPGVKQLVSIADGIVAQLISLKNALD